MKILDMGLQNIPLLLTQQHQPIEIVNLI